MKEWKYVATAMVFCLAGLPALVGAGEGGPGRPRIPGAAPGAVLFETGFEQGQDFPEPVQHEVTDEAAHSGSRSLVASISEDNPVRQYRIPVEGKKGRRIRIALWRRTRSKCRFALFWEHQNPGTGELERRRLQTHPVSGGWEKYSTTFVATNDQNCRVSIVWPSYYGPQNATRAWLDDVTVSDVGPAPGWSAENVQDFPALATDAQGRTWLAMIERPKTDPVMGPRVGVFRVTKSDRKRVATLSPGGITGISRPTLTGRDEGCVVAFGAEVSGQYDIHYSRISGQRGGVRLRQIEVGGNANILPSATRTGDRTCLVWETNAPGHRAVAVSWIDGGDASEPRIISPDGLDCSNPAVTASEDGKVFAAWDCFREGNVDLYGRLYRAGEWGEVQRLTTDPRTERHVDLASHDGTVWMTWEAKSFDDQLVNRPDEQRIVVGAYKNSRLRVPMKLFETVKSGLFLRPWIGFDPEGRLWLTARKSSGQHSGWNAWAWCYGGDSWTDRQLIWNQTGRWRSVPLAWGDSGPVAAVQRDNISTGTTRGPQPSCNSEVTLVDTGPAEAPEPVPLRTTELNMPETQFSLAKQRVEPSNARQPRRQVTHDGRELKLYWGDLHEHTSMSACQRAMNPPAPDLLANQRDVEMLDFTAITDHGYNLDQPQWQYTTEQINSYFDPGSFVTLLGEEWTSKNVPPENPNEPVGKGNPQRYGHRNLILRNSHYPRYFDSFDGKNISPEEVWAQLEGDEFFMVPHQLADWRRKGRGNPPIDWDHHHPHHQPVAEIYQARGSYEYLGAPQQAGAGTPFKGHYLQDAWAKGVVIGVIASPDHGGGNGKAAVWAEELTRDSLFEAIRARHTYGTTDPKIMLFFGSADAMMGDKIPRHGSGDIPFEIQVKAPETVREVVLFRNNEPLKKWQPGASQFRLEWTDSGAPAGQRLWYYCRVQCEDESLAWASPIWFTP